MPTLTAYPLQSPTVIHTNPSQVFVDISTTLLIQDYHKYYHQPIESFIPVYHALPDSSLVAPPLTQDLNDVHVLLLWTGALCAFFIMNIITIIHFIRWGKVKNKTLFYLLLGSQIAGPATYVPLIVSIFDRLSNCYISLQMSATFTFISYSLLVTGIFGTKAYRCLDNSRIVVVVLSSLRTAAFVAFVLDRYNLEVSRRLSGSCMKSSLETYVIAQFIGQLLELLFITSCFLYALRRSRKLPLARGRITISVRTATAPALERPATYERDPRGWWDYAPAESFVSSQKSRVPDASPTSGILLRIRNGLVNLWASSGTALNLQRKPSLHTDYPIRQAPGYTPSFPLPCQPQNDYTDVSRPSSRSSDREWLLIRCLSPFQLLSDVLRNELAFTAMVTLVQTVVTIASLIGTYNNVLLGAYGWSMVNWVLLSFTTLYSFQRVVRRHDREDFLQRPAAWDRVQRAERAVVDVCQEDRIQRTRSLTSCSRSLRYSSSGSSLQASRHLFGDYSLNPVRSRYCCSSCATSVHADNLALPVWKPSCTSIAPSFLDTQSSLEPPSPSESMPQDERCGSEDTLHTFVKGEG